MLLRVRDSVLVVVDMQERLLAAVQDAEAATERTRVLMQAAERLDVPLFVTEQYPKGLGHTTPAVAELAPAESVVEKVAFSACRAPEFAERLARLGRRQVVVCGAETHVCVLQTAADLIEKGFGVHLAADACASRRAADKQAGIERLRAMGADVVTSEMVVFEWLEQAGTEDFRALSKLIK